MQAVIAGAVDIHPTCISPEKKRITDKCCDPIMQLVAINTLMIITTFNMPLLLVIYNSKSGAIFCHVRNNNVITFLRLVITTVPQKCNGAILVFNNSPMAVHLLMLEPISESNAQTRIIKDPIL